MSVLLACTLPKFMIMIFTQNKVIYFKTFRLIVCARVRDYAHMNVRSMINS